MQIQRGTYKIIRVDGSEEQFNEKPTLRAIYQKLKVDCVDTVTLDRQHMTVMDGGRHRDGRWQAS